MTVVDLFRRYFLRCHRSLRGGDDGDAEWAAETLQVIALAGTRTLDDRSSSPKSQILRNGWNQTGSLTGLTTQKYTTILSIHPNLSMVSSDRFSQTTLENPNFIPHSLSNNPSLSSSNTI